MLFVDLDDDDDHLQIAASHLIRFYRLRQH